MRSRQTFSLRELGTEVGSYVRYDMTNFSSASLANFLDTEFYISVAPQDYGVNTVEWSAPTFTKTSTALPVDVMIRWSTLGEPQTAEDGYELLTNVGGNGSADHDLSFSSVYQGVWIYYSMFLRYASTAVDPYGEETQYFDKVASVSTLMPKNHNSVDELWARIPEYFRIQDTSNDLYNYLSIFGWDLDQLRTIVDYLMTQNDPVVASSFSLQYLMEELGTLITTLELGATRARSYMQDIINLRLAKGTEEGIINTIQAISGCQTVIDKINYKIRLYPQRVNWARDPRLRLGLGTNDSWYAATSNGASVRFSVDTLQFNAGASVGDLTFGPTADSTAASLAFNPIRSVVNEGVSPAIVFLYSKFTIPVAAGDTFYFSAENPTTDVLNYAALYYNASPSIVAASAGFSNSESIVKTDDGTTYFKLSVTETTPNSAYLVLGMTVPAGGFALFDKFLLEKNYIGKYFDGYTNYGAVIKGGTDRADYKWHTPTSPPTNAFTTFGIYTADAWRTRKTIQNIYKKLLPVNLMDTYTLEFDYLDSYSATPSAPDPLPDLFALADIVFVVGGTPQELVFVPTSVGASFNIAWPNIL